MKSFLSILALSTLAFLPTRAHAAVDYVLNTNGVVHCNNTSHTEPGFAVYSFSINGSQPVSNSGSTSGSGAGKISLSGLSVVKSFDACSEPLISAFLSGTAIKSLTLTGYKSGTDGAHPIAIITITLDLAHISGYQLSGDSSVPTESFTFAYRTLCVASTALNPDGTPGATSNVCYDAASNAVSH